MSMNIRSRFSERVSVPFVSENPSMTKQSHKDECNINLIIKRYHKTGLLAHQQKHQGDYGEFMDIDFQTAMNTVLRGQEVFDELPSQIRKEFDNDPGAFLAFVMDDNNREKAIDLGIVPRPEPQQAPQEPAKGEGGSIPSP